MNPFKVFQKFGLAFLVIAAVVGSTGCDQDKDVKVTKEVHIYHHYDGAAPQGSNANANNLDNP